MAEENLKLEIDDAGRPLHRAAVKTERRSPWRFRDAVILQADDGTRVAAAGSRFYATTAEGRTDWDRPLRRDQGSRVHPQADGARMTTPDPRPYAH